jgi:hypothetical protein
VRGRRVAILLRGGSGVAILLLRIADRLPD